MTSRNLLLLPAFALAAIACGSDAGGTVEAAPLVVVERSDATVVAQPSDADASADEPDVDELTGDELTGDATGAPAEQTDEERALGFTQCMRDEGVDLADPTINADGSIVLFQPGANSHIDPTDPEVTNAADVCGELIAGASFLPGAGLDRSEIEDRLLGFAQCLRDLGFDVDDPDISGGFAGGPAAIFGDNFDPTDPANADAVQQCQAAFGAGGPFGGNS